MNRRRRAEAAPLDKRDEILDRIRRDVLAHGQSVMFIGDGSDSFHYTIGRGRRGLPELLIAAPLAPEMGMRLLNHIDRLMPHALPSGSLLDLGGQFPVMLIDADNPKAKSHYTLVASNFHGHPDAYRVQQVVMCDKEGRFPPDCADPFSRQPILGSLSRPLRQ